MNSFELGTVDVSPGAAAALAGAGVAAATLAHTRDGYLDAVAAAGCEVLQALDLRFRDVPDGYFTAGMLAHVGDHNFGLLLLARKR